MNYINIILLLLMFCYVRKKSIYISSRIDLVEDNIIRKMRNLNLDNYKQIEDLIALYRILDKKDGIPKTRGWASSPDFLRHLAEYILINKPLMVVECGSGVSTYIIAKVLEINGSGHLYSFEHESIYAKNTRDLLQRSDLISYATVLYAPLKDVVIENNKYKWYSNFENIKKDCIDMLVVDGPPNSTCQNARYPVGPLLASCSNSLKVIFLHDADREDEKSAVEMWCNEMPISEVVNLGCETGAVRIDIKI